VDLNTGLNFGAALLPYVGVGIGLSGALAAGFRLQGEARVDANLGLNPYLLLEGGEEGFSGELGIGLHLGVTASLGLKPQLYATVGKTFTYDLTEVTIPLGELFSYDWSGKYGFGDQGASTEAGGPSQAESPAAQNTQAANESEPDMSSFGAAQEAPAKEGGPQLESPDEMEQKTGGAGGGEDKMAALKEKLDEAQRYASLISGVAKIAGEVMTAATIGMMVPMPFGLAAVGAYFVYLHVTEKLTFDEIKATLVTLWEVIVELDIPGLIAGLLPDWMLAIYEYVTEKGLAQAIRDLVEFGKEAIKSAIGDSWYNVIEPLIDVLETNTDTLADIIEKIMGGGLTVDDMVEIAMDLAGMAAGSVRELASALRSMASRMGGLLGMLVDRGDIYVRTVEENIGPDDMEYQIRIPGVCNFSGDSWTLSNLIIEAFDLIGLNVHR
jgi:hypothetical protein